MDVNRSSYSEYYNIRAGEGPREIYINFDDGNGPTKGTVAKCVFKGDGFTTPPNTEGGWHLGVAVTRLTILNAPMNITKENHTNTVLTRSIEGGYTELELREGYYSNIETVHTELQSLVQHNLVLDWDNLGLVRLTGDGDFFVKTKNHNIPIPDHIGTLYGIHDNEKIEHDGNTYMRIASDIATGHQQATIPGDMFGAFTDCTVTCDQVEVTPEADQVVQISPLANNPERAYVSTVFSPSYRPIILTNRTLRQLTFRLKDRYNRPLRSSTRTGLPSATIQLMSLA